MANLLKTGAKCFVVTSNHFNKWFSTKSKQCECCRNFKDFSHFGKIIAIVWKIHVRENSFYMHIPRFNRKTLHLKIIVQETHRNVSIFKSVPSEEYLSNNTFSLIHSYLSLGYNTKTNWQVFVSQKAAASTVYISDITSKTSASYNICLKSRPDIKRSIDFNWIYIGCQSPISLPVHTVNILTFYQRATHNLFLPEELRFCNPQSP